MTQDPSSFFEPAPIDVLAAIIDDLGDVAAQLHAIVGRQERSKSWALQQATGIVLAAVTKSVADGGES